MAQEVIWTERASDDLHHIFEYLSTFSDTRAESVVEDIIERAFQLEQFPRMGRIVPELNIQALREIIVEQYRVVYALTSQGNVEILAVRHSARPLPEL
ncbi:MAG: type II toxin-antitoxin system RelE/ParE family toxin [Saprospiraceae bacterium]|jgi:toxin ParE1/3/4|nr:type II toxin-antitoxin system RelE/ParE family toxin [Lewinellaceae bacterium]MBP6811310.1 type II toxin-antitoxin system RelE/ParE family toxin [Saprospiraceae bacterium]